MSGTKAKAVSTRRRYRSSRRTTVRRIRGGQQVVATPRSRSRSNRRPRRSRKAPLGHHMSPSPSASPSVVALGKPSVVAFGKLYSNQCGHCMAMVEAWDKMKGTATHIACEDIEASGIDAELAQLNKKYQTDVAVQGGYPTIFKIVRDSHGKNQVMYYDGDRSADAMTTWVTTA